MTGTRRVAVLWALVTAPLLTMQAAALVAPPESDFREVVQSAIAREQRIKTVKCSWKVRQVIPKGSRAVPDPFTLEMVGTDQPGEDLVAEDVYTLVLDGSRVFHDSTCWLWSIKAQALVPLHSVAAFADGRHVGLDDRGRGLITPRADVLMLVAFHPIVFAYRLFDPSLGQATADGLSFVGRAEQDGHPCLVVEHSGRMGERDQYWLAVDQEGCPVRWESYPREGPPASHASMRYERTPDGLWYLQSWELGGIFGGAPDTSKSATVTEVRLNEPVDPSIFQITFPSGTYVSNQFDETEYVVGEEAEPQAEAPLVPSEKAMEEFVQKVEKETGAKRPEPQARPVAPLTAPPARLAPEAARPAALAPPPRMPAWSWALVGAGVLALLIVGGIALRRRRAGSS